MIVEYSLNSLQLTGIVGENIGVLGDQVMLQSISFDSTFEIFQQVDTVLNTLGLAEIVINKCLKLGIQLRNGDVERHILFVKCTVSQIKQVSFSFLFEVVSDCVELVDNHIHFL